MSEELETQKVNEKGRGNDLSSAFLDILAREATEYREVYINLIAAIEIGTSLLDDSELKNKALSILANSDIIPKAQRMEWVDNGRYYMIGTGNPIQVRPEELEIGRKHAENQECKKLLSQLLLLKNEILEKLAATGVIKKVDKKIADMIKEKLQEELNGSI